MRPRVGLKIVSRREVLAGGAAMAAGCVTDTEKDPPVADTAVEEAMDPVTSAAEFYVTSCCGTPDVDAATWSLTIRDRGTIVGSFGLTELAALTPRDREHTLECISAGPYNLAISNGVWTGLPLTEILEALGIPEPEGALEMAFTAADDYTTSLPVAELQGMWLVWKLNGEDLPPEHGYPARLLVPGRYGMKNPKWIVEIDFVDEAVIGFWESRGWSNTAEYRVNTLVHQPTRLGSWPAGALRLLGSAFAGRDPVVAVEVRIDGGAWQSAKIDYAPGADVWTLWHFDWDADAGTHTLQARCTTASGVQSGGAESTGYLEGYDGSMEVEVEIL